ncbi:ATP-grasp domain-containing protein [Streptomyces sp. NBC_01186]|uniref:carboxylate--amine ligase n=1 Tax=unclassified Streptomyces TaxID=2593676 RepID=UPI002DDAA871|nr:MULTISPECIES: ATP-grasp domain-containing protein [unclassified Streptomyces]WSS14316.1 ATP-grasp domain-containing protein [Streptomyces sp. NBC_01186]
MKIGNYPLHHGGVGAIRSLGRLGVPMYAITEDRWTPAARSRYLREAFVWPTTGREPAERLLAGLLATARRLGGPAVLIPTDEEAAVLIAEHQRELSAHFLFPPVPPKLPRRLASKQGLHELCTEHGIATPVSVSPRTYAEVEWFAARARFPMVAKNREAFVRRARPAVGGTTRVSSARELLAMARGWGDSPGVLLQEYLPLEEAEDWIVHGYFSPESEPRALFTGVKVRSWPPHAGMTASARTVANPELAELTAGFVKRLGFTGVLDLDWRFDRRDGRYKLLDFNPRTGAQFRMFESESGVDVVRALHLDLTGRAVPGGVQREGRRYLVEHIDPAARLAYLYGRGRGYRTPHAPSHTRAQGTELAWAAADDPLPAAVLLVRLARPGARHLWQLWGPRGSSSVVRRKGDTR